MLIICKRCGAFIDKGDYCYSCLINLDAGVKMCEHCGETKPFSSYPVRYVKQGRKKLLPVCKECKRKEYIQKRSEKNLTTCLFRVEYRGRVATVCLNDYLNGTRKANNETINQILAVVSRYLGKPYIYDRDKITCHKVTIVKGSPHHVLETWAGLQRYISKKDKRRKLSRKDILAIRRGLLKGITQKALAEKYDVSASLIGKIKRGER